VLFRSKVGVDTIATHSQIRESEVLAVLEIEKMDGRIEYGKKFVRFLKEPDASVKRVELSDQDNLIRVTG